MKTKKKKAQYLTVEGNEINEGDTYYIVDAIRPFDLHTCEAGDENNVLHKCYFKIRSQAEHYQRLCELYRLIASQIENIEVKHQNR